MAFNHQQYNTQYVLNNIRGNNAPINDALSKYGVRIVEADVTEGETYWRVIGVHHLEPRENFSKHNVYVEALDETGQRVQNPFASALTSTRNERLYSMNGLRAAHAALRPRGILATRGL